MTDIVKRLRNHAYPMQVWDKDEAADEIERLRKQVEDCEGDFHALKQMFDRTREQLALAHSILASESMGWLAGGTSNHEASHWGHLMPYIRTYWNKYGSFFRPVTDES